MDTIEDKKTVITERNRDGSPVQSVKEDGREVGTIHNKETVQTERNADGTPVKEVQPS